LDTSPPEAPAAHTKRFIGKNLSLDLGSEKESFLVDMQRDACFFDLQSSEWAVELRT